jgi:hypothetical protein
MARSGVGACLPTFAITGTSDADFSIRQAAHDLRKLRGKQLADKPARTRAT